MTLEAYTGVELMVPRLQGRDPGAVISELAQLLQQTGRIPDAAAFCAAVMGRESQAGTDWAPGAAFPHGRLPGIDRPAFALGRAPVPILWGHRSVGLVWLMAVPEHDVRAYLALLAGVARLTDQPGLMRALREAEGPGPMLAVLRQLGPGTGAPAGREPTQTGRCARSIGTPL